MFKRRVKITIDAFKIVEMHDRLQDIEAVLGEYGTMIADVAQTQEDTRAAISHLFKYGDAAHE